MSASALVLRETHPADASACALVLDDPTHAAASEGFGGGSACGLVLREPNPAGSCAMVLREPNPAGPLDRGAREPKPPRTSASALVLASSQGEPASPRGRRQPLPALPPAETRSELPPGPQPRRRPPPPRALPQTLPPPMPKESAEPAPRSSVAAPAEPSASARVLEQVAGRIEAEAPVPHRKASAPSKGATRRAGVSIDMIGQAFADGWQRVDPLSYPSDDIISRVLSAAEASSNPTAYAFNAGFRESWSRIQRAAAHYRAQQKRAPNPIAARTAWDELRDAYMKGWNDILDDAPNEAQMTHALRAASGADSPRGYAYRAGVRNALALEEKRDRAIGRQDAVFEGLDHRERALRAKEAMYLLADTYAQALASTRKGSAQTDKWLKAFVMRNIEEAPMEKMREAFPDASDDAIYQWTRRGAKLMYEVGDEDIRWWLAEGRKFGWRSKGDPSKRFETAIKKDAKELRSGPLPALQAGRARAKVKALGQEAEALSLPAEELNRKAGEAILDALHQEGEECSRSGQGSPSPHLCKIIRIMTERYIEGRSAEEILQRYPRLTRLELGTMRFAYAEHVANRFHNKFVRLWLDRRAWEREGVRAVAV